MGRVETDPIKRFMANIETDPKTGCWLWQGPTYHGYGRFFADGRKTLAHRWMYEYRNGPIHNGLLLRHLCKIRLCCNPSHLELATHKDVCVDRKPKEAKTHCIRGHPFDDENTYFYLGRMRTCRECVRIRRSGETRSPKNADKTHCPHGHPYSGDNLYIAGNGQRRCRECIRIGNHKQAEKRRIKIQ